VKLRLAALALALPLALTACGGGSSSGKSSAPSKKTLNVFAAASLTETFQQLGKTFEASHPGVTVKFNFGGSSALAQQITQGAPADVFAAASPATMKTVTDAGDAATTPATFVKNELEIAVPPSNPAKITGLKDLANTKYKVVLCAAQVPCGAAATKALTGANLKVTPVSLEQDVKGVLTKVELGEADAGLVYKTDVNSADGRVKGIDFPEAATAINAYPIAVLKDAPQPGLAKEFTALVTGPQGLQVLTAAGFEAP